MSYTARISREAERAGFFGSITNSVPYYSL
jgi:hypothetical protein